MSSILKALKKLEDEKITRKPESLKIHSEILRESTSFRLTSLKAGTVAVLFFLCGGGAAYLYLKPSLGTSLVPSVIEADKQEAQPALNPPSPVITTTRVIAKPITPSAPSLSSTPPSSISPNRPTVVQKTRSQVKKDIESSQKNADGFMVPVKVNQQTSPASDVRKAIAPLRPFLKVDGIAFQEDDNSVAIINGTQATKTSIIEGAKVEAILKDRVIFILGGDKFEVLLGRASR